jgi:plasmid stabilization system protein ParE
VSRLPVDLAKKARRDVIEIYKHYAAEAGPKISRLFYSDFRSVMNRIGSFPGLGEPLRFSHVAESEARRMRLSSRFRTIVLFYEVHEDRVEVLRVLHAGRDFETILADDG